MYKILTDVEKHEEIEKKKGKNKAKHIFYTTQIRFIDLDKRFTKIPITNFDAISYLNARDENEKDIKKIKRIENYIAQEAALAKNLTVYLDKRKANRTRLHKELGISSSTLEKLEKNPLALNEKLRARLRKKIYIL